MLALSKEERKELVREIARIALSDEQFKPALIVTMLQRSPYTGVLVLASLPLDATDDDAVKTVSAVGFSKVSWPDKWDAEHGRELAVKRAAAEIVRKWDWIFYTGGK